MPALNGAKLNKTEVREEPVLLEFGSGKPQKREVEMLRPDNNRFQRPSQASAKACNCGKDGIERSRIIGSDLFIQGQRSRSGEVFAFRGEDVADGLEQSHETVCQRAPFAGITADTFTAFGSAFHLARCPLANGRSDNPGCAGLRRVRRCAAHG
jgi:hypothetical protein